METFLWGLLAAYIAAVVFVSYDKPDFYLERLDNWVTFLPIVAFMLANMWNFAAQMGYFAVRDLIPDEKIAQASVMAEKAQVPTELLLILGGLLVLSLVTTFVAKGMRDHLRGKA